ncbi:MAG: type II toxin-antitoxin system Phd/YefM family antitoxin [Micrococcales bacterium]
MSRQVNIHEAKTHFSKLVEAAEAGEEITIARSGKPVLRLVPYTEPEVQRELGRLSKAFKDFDWNQWDKQDAELAKLWEKSLNEKLEF